MVFENPAENSIMYSEYFQQLRRSRLQETFCVANFLIAKICSKYSCFWFQKAATFIKRSKKIELTLNIEFGMVAFFTTFIIRKNWWITCAIPCSENQDRNHTIMSIHPVLVEEIYKWRRDKSRLLSLFIQILSRLSDK